MENILVTWHYTTHGIAYLKHILSAFHEKGGDSHSQFVEWKGLSQSDYHVRFDDVRDKGFVFDKVYYLTAEQKVFDKISNRKKYRKEMEQDPYVLKEGTSEIWKTLNRKNNPRSPSYIPNMEDDFSFVEKEFPNQVEIFKKQIWRDIHHYHISDQIHWFKAYSNAREVYNNRFIEIPTGVTNLREPRNIIDGIKPKLDKIFKKHRNANFFIVISLGSSETQVVWHVMSQANLLPLQCKFIKAYDQKDDVEHLRFKNFDVIEVPLKLFDEIKPIPVFSNTKSEKRRIAKLKMEYYIKAGFSTLILGERGTGKSRLAQEYKDEKKNFINANCASFEDDSKAETELFGYKKGAFTGADRDYEGLFKKAANGVLFLDEIHHLSKRVQEKLMTALSTDKDNYFRIRRVGDSEGERIKCTVIFASNRSINQLRKILYPDFFDRVVQNVIELPPLRDTVKDRLDDWRSIWKQMRFDEIIGEAPCDKELMQWLCSLNLYGNYRDLQKIAMYYVNYNRFNKVLIGLLKKEYGILNIFDYIKHEFGELQSSKENSENSNLLFSKDMSIDQIKKEFRNHLYQWMLNEFRTEKKAIEFYKNTYDESLTSKTLYNWKNKK